MGIGTTGERINLHFRCGPALTEFAVGANVAIDKLTPVVHQICSRRRRHLRSVSALDNHHDKPEIASSGRVVAGPSRFLAALVYISEPCTATHLPDK